MPITQAQANHGARTRRSRIRQIATGVAVSLGVAGLVVTTIRGPQSNATGSAPNCAPRVIVIDTSSSDRSPELSEFANSLIDTAAKSAAICGTSLSAIAVAGGGQQSPIITSDDLAGLAPIGPTPQIRSLRFSSSQQAELARTVTTRLLSAYQVGDPKVTSIGALYDAASQQIGHEAQVVLVTDGVNDDAQLNLNRPLEAGQGAALAGVVHVASLRGTSVTLVGIAQVDSSIPPPSPTWPEAIQSFNVALCHASFAVNCRIFDTTSLTKALDA